MRQISKTNLEEAANMDLLTKVTIGLGPIYLQCGFFLKFSEEMIKEKETVKK